MPKLIRTEPYPRHREDLNQATAVVPRSVTFYQTPPFHGTITIGASGENRWMDDVVTPDYSARSAQGVVINNRCSWTKDSITRTVKPINRVCSNIPRTGDPVAAFWGAAPLDAPPANPALYPLDFGRLQSLACTHALGGIAPPDTTSLLTLGELAETIALIRNPVSALTQGFKQLLKLKQAYFRTKAAGVVTNAIASQYLAVMFGMMPAINDLKSYMDLLSRFVPPRRTARGKAQDTYTRTETRPYANPYQQPFIGSTKLEGTCEVWVRAGSLYEYDLRDDFSAMFGTRLSDVPIALWQLTKFSFLVDWLLNISSMIKAVTPVAGVKRLAEWYSIKVVTTETITLSALTHTPVTGWTGTGGGDSVTRVVETYVRVPCNLGDHIGITYNIKWNPTKTLLSLSLLTQTIYANTLGKPVPVHPQKSHRSKL